MDKNPKHPLKKKQMKQKSTVIETEAVQDTEATLHKNKKH